MLCFPFEVAEHHGLSLTNGKTAASVSTGPQACEYLPRLGLLLFRLVETRGAAPAAPGRNSFKPYAHK
jgi:hypothetical protein